MATLTGSGVVSLGAFSIGSGAGGILEPDPGPNTRGLTVNFDLKFSGNYYDEVNGEKMAEINWGATGFKFTEVPGNTKGGQSNRFWMRRALRIESGQAINLDMYSFLSLNGGMGFGQDQLGLGIIIEDVTMLVIRNRIGGAPLLLGGAPHAPWTSLFTGRLSIPAGYNPCWETQNIDAWEVTQGVKQYLRLEPSGGACIVDIYIGGRYIGS